MKLAYRQLSKTASLHRGFTLLEVLIAIVVLSIGLLGLAGLQAAGLRSNNGAYMRTMATQQAYDMADRMRANPEAVGTGAYAGAAGTATPACLTSTGCSATALAAHDIFEWNAVNANILPSGKGTIAASGVAGRFIITVRWDETRTGATGTGCGSNLTVDLTCFTMEFTP